MKTKHIASSKKVLQIQYLLLLLIVEVLKMRLNMAEKKSLSKIFADRYRYAL